MVLNPSQATTLPDSSWFHGHLIAFGRYGGRHLVYDVPSGQSDVCEVCTIQKDGFQPIPISFQENREQALKLAAGDEITRPQLRQLILLLVEKVESPVYVEDRFVREKAKTGLRRYARVTLKEPIGTGERVFLSAIYTSRYKGEKDAPFACP